MILGGKWYSITLVKDAVWGLLGACEVLVEKKSRRMSFWTDEEIQRAFLRIFGVEKTN